MWSINHELKIHLGFESINTVIIGFFFYYISNHDTLMFEANGKYSQKDPYGYNQGTTSKLGWSYSEERYYNASYQEILNFISSLLLLCFVGATAPMRRALRHLFPIVGQWVNYCMDLFIATQIMYDLLDINNHICLCLRCDFIEWWRLILDYSNVTMSEWTHDKHTWICHHSSNVI